MFPTNPTLEEWRKLASYAAKRKGIAVPSWYDGTTAADQRMSQEGLTDIRAAITWEQQAYVLDHDEQFPSEKVAYATDWIARHGASSSAYAATFAQDAPTGFDRLLASDAAGVAIDAVEVVADATGGTAIVNGVKSLVSPKAVETKAQAIFRVALPLILIGAAIGGGIYYLKKRA